MGHHTLKGQYLDLQRRLDQNAVGAPASEVLFEILSLLFTEEEAGLAARMPYGFCSTGRLARILGMPAEQLEPKLDLMAEKGLLFDVRQNEKAYWYLNPLVIGFFEFTMMRVRPTLDQKRVALKMHEYLFEDPASAFLMEISAGRTQLFRPLAHENTLEEGKVEVLDWDRATHMVGSARAWTVGLCHCRHVAQHRGTACDNPMENCISLSAASQYLGRRGMARFISREECLDLLVQAREHGLVQLGDNVKQGGLFICNCCKCCCGLLEGYRRLGPAVNLHTSNFIASVNQPECKGCGVCVKACPVNAITRQDAERGTDLAAAGESAGTESDAGAAGGPRARKVARIAEDTCIGCGVCAAACRNRAMIMLNRPARVHTPESTLEKMVLMLLERGKLQNLIFDDPERVSHQALRRLVRVLLRLHPAQRAQASDQIKSRFVRRFLKLAKHKPGASTL